MPGRSSNSPLGRAVGLVVAGLAVVLYALNRWTDLGVPHGYGSGSDALLVVGAVVAAVAVGLGGYRFFSDD
jgi:hypothetical protein